MAFYDTTRPANTTGRFSRAISGIVAEISAWNDARVTRAALSRLSDHELSDIGLQRSDLDGMGRSDLSRF